MASFPNWLIESLGRDAPDIARTFSICLSAADLRARNAQDVSGLRQRNPYGSTLWLAVYEEFASVLGPVEGAHFFQPRFASYRLVVLNGTLIYPFRHHSDLSVPLEDARLKLTPLRRDLLDHDNRLTVEQTFDFTALAEDGDNQWLTSGLISEAEDFDRILFIPFASNAEAGMLAAAIGMGPILGDGSVAWRHFARLDDSLYRGVPQLVVPAIELPRFDSSELPVPLLKTRTEQVDAPEESDEMERAERQAEAGRADNGTDE